jgi:hypothetical protein
MEGVPTRLEDNEEERLARVEEIMRRNRIDDEDLEAYVARVRERAAKVRDQAMKNWPTLPPLRKKRS